MSKPKLLIIEDDVGLCNQYRWAFPKYETVFAHDRPAAMRAAQSNQPPVAIMDLGLPPDADGVSEGFAALEQLSRQLPDMKVVVATSHSDRIHALRAVASGAYDFCEKPIEIDVLRTVVDRALRLYELEQENRQLSQVTVTGPLGGIVTSSDAMLQVTRTIERVAPTNITVLLLGESGTGKELLARALHELSPRAREPFVAINCAAIPETLLESELFGYERGAFTGAVRQTSRQDRTRQLRHAISRRDRRFAAAAAGKAATVPPGTDGRAYRWPGTDTSGRAGGVGNQCRYRGAVRGRNFPQRPVLPAQLNDRAHPTVARTRW